MASMLQFYCGLPTKPLAISTISKSGLDTMVICLTSGDSKVRPEYIREVQYADDISISSDSALVLQLLLTAYNEMAKRMGHSINTIKTETMCIGPLVEFSIDGEKLKNLKHFKYLGSYVTDDCSIKEELTSRMQYVSCAYERLRTRVFDSHELTLSTKVKVCNQRLMPLLLYGCETWTLLPPN